MGNIAVADTFFSSLLTLSAADAKRVIAFVEKFRANPRLPGFRSHRVERSPDPGLWTAYISQDANALRAIYHLGSGVYTLLRAGRHDEQYERAERQRIARHMVTGALQIVESPALDKRQPTHSFPPTEPQPIFADYDDSLFLRLGVPKEWLPVVQQIRSQDELSEVIDGLPGEAAERLIDLSEGIVPEDPEPQTMTLSPFEHPDTRRRFWVVEDDALLERMLAAPHAAWVTFLHPSQRRAAEGSFRGPVKITGSAGTGKTVVAMHRANNLARSGRTVLLTSYTNALCTNIERNLALLCAAEDRRRIVVRTVHGVALDIISAAGLAVRPPKDFEVRTQIERARIASQCPFSTATLTAEWEAVVQAQRITTWDAYRVAKRTGRGRAFSPKERRQVWAVFERVYAMLQQAGVADWSALCAIARDCVLAELDGPADPVTRRAGLVRLGLPPVSAVVIDEAQDLGPQQVTLLAAIAGQEPDALAIIGDGGQRIYARGFSLRALGIETRGRSHLLRVNYRTTEQVRRFADRIGGGSGDDLDGGREPRRAYRSLIRGPEPVLRGFPSAAVQYHAIAEQIRVWQAEEIPLDEVAVIARTKTMLDSVGRALGAEGLRTRRATQPPRETPAATLVTMHNAKGLEFRAVVVADVSDRNLPSPGALWGLEDERDIEDALTRERQALYVALTRARGEVLITWSGTPSPFLQDAERMTGDADAAV